MKLLAIDTATEACSAALGVGEMILTRYEEPGRAHAERILPIIDELLAEAGLALSQLDAIAFGRGPGAFTGLRIAAGVVQGLAFGAGLPVIAVSNLEALAARALAERPGAGAIACIDARMAEVYWCAFRYLGPDDMVALGSERVTPPDAVTLDVLLSEKHAWIGAGTGFGAYSTLGALLGLRADAIAGALLPRAQEILRIAQREFRAGRVLAPEQAVPVYLRDQVAVVPSR
jgi:tRNA threonylcarbamoyladenosine biosynthesis protein TsaB